MAAQNYKLTEDEKVIRPTDNAFIPDDPTLHARKVFGEFVLAGGSADPAVQQELADYKVTAIEYVGLHAENRFRAYIPDAAPRVREARAIRGGDRRRRRRDDHGGRVPAPRVTDPGGGRRRGCCRYGDDRGAGRSPSHAGDDRGGAQDRGGGHCRRDNDQRGQDHLHHDHLAVVTHRCPYTPQSAAIVPVLERDYSPRAAEINPMLTTYRAEDPAKRSGLFTSEFLIAALALVFGFVLTLKGSEETGKWLMSVAVGAYATSRAITKASGK